MEKPKPFDFHTIVAILNDNELIANIEKILIDEIVQRGFYKIKCRLIPSKYKLEMKFIKTRLEFIYSYQLFTTESIARWDNEPHFPFIRSFPHHFHDADGDVLESDLTGDWERDLRSVLSKIKEYLI